VDTRSQSLSGGIVRITVAGEIDMATVDQLSRELRGAFLHDGTTEVVIDFADVTFCDSSGFAALDRAYAESVRRDTAFRLINVQPQVRRLLEILDMLDILAEPDDQDR
jgi:anti-anti-sigma factor